MDTPFGADHYSWMVKCFVTDFTRILWSGAIAPRETRASRLWSLLDFCSPTKRCQCWFLSLCLTSIYTVYIYCINIYTVFYMSFAYDSDFIWVCQCHWGSYNKYPQTIDFLPNSTSRFEVWVDPWHTESLDRWSDSRSDSLLQHLVNEYLILHVDICCRKYQLNGR